MKANPFVESAVTSALTRIFECFVDGDVDRWLTQLIDDPDVAWIATGPEEFATGADKLRAMVDASIVGTSDRSYDIAWASISAEGDVAWVIGEATIVAHAAGRRIALPFRFTGVFVKRDGRWLVANFHQSVGDARQTGATWDSLMDTIAIDAQRERPAVAQGGAPEGTVTLLFTDIEESTQLTEQLGDLRWIELLREHNAIVRGSTAAHGGYEVKTIGDAFMLAFPSARRALQCAIEIQRAFAAFARERPGEELRIRIGLHAGEPIRDADDFYGRSVILASRIAAQATGGEVLVSSLLKELTDSAGDISYGEPRYVELKGLAGNHALFPVIWQMWGTAAPSAGNDLRH